MTGVCFVAIGFGFNNIYIYVIYETTSPVFKMPHVVFVPVVFSSS